MINSFNVVAIPYNFCSLVNCSFFMAVVFHVEASSKRCTTHFSPKNKLFRTCLEKLFYKLY